MSYRHIRESRYHGTRYFLYWCMYPYLLPFVGDTNLLFRFKDNGFIGDLQTNIIRSHTKINSIDLFRQKKRSHSEGRAKDERRMSEGTGRYWWRLLPSLLAAGWHHLWPAKGIGEDSFDSHSRPLQDHSSAKAWLELIIFFPSVTLRYENAS